MLFKRDHSIRVAATNGLIARQIGLEGGEIWLAKLIGLFHDVARYEQFHKYRTFRDPLSFDHGDYGAELISRMVFFKGFDPALVKMICAVISYHNKKDVPEGLQKKLRIHTQLIRDADKLDIIYITCRSIRNGSVHVPTIASSNKDTITPEVVKALTERRPIDYGLVKTEHDFLLVKIGWIYDLNFLPSLAMFNLRGSLGVLKEALPAVEGLDALLAEIDTYIHEKLAQYS